MTLRETMRTAFVCFLSFAAWGGNVHAESGLERYTFHETHMGTRFKIIVYAPDKAKAARASKTAFARIADLDRIMSDYRQTSELMQLCEKSAGTPIPVSPDLFRVLSRAQDLSRRTDGAFDVTIGPLVKLWRRTRFTKKLPSAATLAETRALVGFPKLKLDKEKRTAIVGKGMKLDLGGIAKGFACDEAREVLEKQGLRQVLVAAGGDIVVGDPPPEEKGWNVGIAPLEDPDARPKRTLLLKNQAVSTSGDAEQFLEIDGKRYSHIVDPRTGLGLRGRISVTVIAKDGTTSDSLATAVNVLGVKKGLELIEATPGTAAFIVVKTEKGEEQFYSKNFPK